VTNLIDITAAARGADPDTVAGRAAVRARLRRPQGRRRGGGRDDARARAEAYTELRGDEERLEEILAAGAARRASWPPRRWPDVRAAMGIGAVGSR
jgi:hypothetical protein